MPDLSRKDPLNRFTGLAAIYARARPDYPAAAIDFILQHCGLRAGAQLVDVGSGTGISARRFAACGLRVIGIEPNADMRRQAEAEPEHRSLISYREGKAEATGLPNASADAVLAAQAFHWFASEAALREFRRILRAAGWVIVIANERDESDPASAAYGQIVGASKEAAAIEQPRRVAAQALRNSPLVGNAERRQFGNEQVVDEEGLLGRAFSASYAPKEPKAVEQFVAALRRVFAQYQSGGQFHLRYVTSVDVAQFA